LTLGLAARRLVPMFNCDRFETESLISPRVLGLFWILAGIFLMKPRFGTWKLNTSTCWVFFLLRVATFKWTSCEVWEWQVDPGNSQRRERGSRNTVVLYCQSNHVRNREWLIRSWSWLRHHIPEVQLFSGHGTFGRVRTHCQVINKGRSFRMRMPCECHVSEFGVPVNSDGFCDLPWKWLASFQVPETF
jgi:hypothetical protein